MHSWNLLSWGRIFNKVWYVLTESDVMYLGNYWIFRSQLASSQLPGQVSWTQYGMDCSKEPLPNFKQLWFGLAGYYWSHQRCYVGSDAYASFYWKKDLSRSLLGFRAPTPPCFVMMMFNIGWLQVHLRCACLAWPGHTQAQQVQRALWDWFSGCLVSTCIFECQHLHNFML